MSPAEELILDQANSPSTCAEAPLTVIKIIFGLITAILRAASTSFLLLAAMLLGALGILTLVGFLGFGVTGVSCLRFFRRHPPKPNQP